MEVTGRMVLDTPMESGDVPSARTIRDYLLALLSVLWAEQEGFSGKRPFGNSAWEYDVYAALIKAGHVNGTMDSDGYVEKIEVDAANKLVQSAIRELGKLT
jgi:hypothetical protein